jgi:hypothetical protein
MSETPESIEAVEPEAVEPEAVVEEAPVEAAEPVREAPAQARRPKNNAEAGVPTSIEPGTRVLVSALESGRFSRRSASVEAVQRKLVELGHAEAGSDPRGRLEEHTSAAIEAFVASRGRRLVQAPAVDVVRALFEGTEVEVVD